MEHQDRADELEREADAAGEASERLGEDVEQQRSEWEAKKSDESVPGAVGEDSAGPHQLEGEDPATGEQPREERQDELEDAAHAEAEAVEDDRDD